MSKIQLIPAIDLIDGKCVRLTKGDYDTKKAYNENPLEVAKSFEGVGIERLHLVDLDGAKAKKPTNLAVLETIAANTNLSIDFGGGIRTSEDLGRVLDAGADFVTCCSIAVKDKPEFLKWIEAHGSDKFILAADAKDEMIAVHGWLETSELSVFDFIEDYMGRGVDYILCTDIAKDGMLEGPSSELYGKIQERFPTIRLIASGGIRNMEDIKALDEMGVHSVVFGKSIYEGFITVDDMKAFIA